MTLRLHSFWMATAPYRVRIALELKGVAYDYAPVDISRDAHRQPPYASLNPQRLTPTLETDDGLVLTQSLAILEWLEETHPAPALLPAAPADRAVVRAMMGIVACDIHPLNNRRVLDRLSALELSGAVRQAWTQGWLGDGMAVLETLVARHGAGFAFGPAPTLADCLLIPCLHSARRFGVDMAPFPALAAVGQAAEAHPAFAAARPERQPDAPPSA